MLFDLKGKRRRTVQITYLALAILMGAGLVLFGIGSSVNGGLGDLFKGGNGSNKAEQTIQKKIDAANRTLVRDPKNQAALVGLIQSHYQLATAKGNANGDFTKDSRPELVAATNAWKRYEALANKPSPDVANNVIQAYEGLASLDLGGASATDDWGGAAGAAEVIAGAKPTPTSYARLVYYATLAGQTRRADLAAQQAVRVAPKNKKKAAKALVASAKQSAAQVQQQQSSAGGGQSGAPAPTPTPTPAPSR